MPVGLSSSLTVRVLLFASYADRLGLDSIALTLPAPATVGTVLERLRALPGGELLPPHPLCARNLAHVGLDAPLSSGDEIAILPPLAGG
jgi:molybdopterin converting factor small subunit